MFTLDTHEIVLAPRKHFFVATSTLQATFLSGQFCLCLRFDSYCLRVDFKNINTYNNNKST